MCNAKTQHFVSRGLLSSFKCTESTKKVTKIYFIKIHEKIPSELNAVNLKKIAAVNYLYNYTDDEIESLEKSYFNVIDSEVVGAINSCGNDVEVNDQNKIKIINYMAAQITRTPDTLKLITQLDSLFRSEFGEDYCFTKSSTVKNNFLKTIISNTDSYIEILKDKKFKLHEDQKKLFVISDNPVLLLNSKGKYEMEFTEQNYISVINYPIFIMPISPTKLIIIYDENISDDEINYFIENHNRLQFMYANKMVFSNKKPQLIEGVKTLYEDNYNYLERMNPGITKENNIKFGNPISVGKPEIVLTPEVSEKIKNSMINKVV